MNLSVLAEIISFLDINQYCCGIAEEVELLRDLEKQEMAQVCLYWVLEGGGSSIFLSYLSLRFNGVNWSSKKTTGMLECF